MIQYYKLIDKKLVRNEDALTQSSQQIVARDIDIENNVEISTVFLYFDHNHGKDKPLFFETMVFGGEHNEYR